MTRLKRYPFWPATLLLAAMALGAVLMLTWGAPYGAPGPCPDGLDGCAAAPKPRRAKTTMERAYGRLPLHFEENRGQAGQAVRFLSRGAGYSLFLTPTEAVLALNQMGQAAGAPAGVLRLRLAGSNPEPQVLGREQLPGRVNYFVGADPAKWRTDVPTYARVAYRQVYPGVDLVYYGNQRHLEYDFVVAPGADPKSIRLSFAGAQRLELDAAGDLVLHVGGARVRQHKPLIYQEVGGARRRIEGAYVLRGGQQVAFRVASYDAARPLVIDPVLVYSTFLGGGGSDNGVDITLDGDGSAYVTGSTSSADFPANNPLQPDHGGSFDAFVSKLSADGSALVYSTYLGGGGSDNGTGVAVDAGGNAYVTGSTSSANFPTANALQPASGGSTDAFVAKLSADGAVLAYSTYLGGSSTDSGGDIAVDADGNAYLTGSTFSSNFPRTSYL